MTRPPVPPPADASAAPPDAPAHTALLRVGALVGLAAIGSRVLGFVRDMGMAWLLGNTPAADALVVALRLPHVLRRLVGEGSLSFTLTADLTRHAEHGLDAHAIARAVEWRLALWLGLCLLLAEAAARPLAALLAPGMAHDASLMHESASLLRLCLPYAFTAALTACAMARLHARGHFLLPALTPAVFNVVVLCAIGLAASPLAAQADAALRPAQSALWIAGGVLCGGGMQWLLLAVAEARVRRNAAPASVQGAPVAKNASDRARDRASKSASNNASTNDSVNTREARRALARLPAGLLSAGAPQLCMLIAMTAASWLPQGGLAALYYAERLIELPLGAAGAALGIAALPTLAQRAAAQDHAAFARITRASLELSLCLTLPAAAGLLALAEPMVQVLFARGAFDAAAVSATALALCGYAPAVPAFALTRPLLAACQAAQLTRVSAWSGALAIGVTSVGGVLACGLLPSSVALLGPALSVTVALWAQCVFLYGRLSRRLVGQGECICPNVRGITQQVFAAMLTGLAARGIVGIWPGTVWGLALAVLVGVLVYAALLSVLRNAVWVALWRRARG